MLKDAPIYADIQQDIIRHCAHGADDRNNSGKIFYKNPLLIC